MKLRSSIMGLIMALLLAGVARAQHYTIMVYDGRNGTGKVIMTHTGPMLSPVQFQSTILC